ncbi:MAG: PfkB family carbohydrate kinase [Treponema sp.]|uniref:carbohydrate kinase family protein n=1 Tax=Treponema sp. TaxID=166 RepID=UPI003FA2BB6A
MKKITGRETEILQWIRENPLISQNELAEKAGITRSSVSVHISNLIKKGLILGKGYVTGGSKPVTVIGAVNIDISASASASFRKADSNPGKIKVSAGGVGFNIASNSALLGVPVCFISAFGGDTHASFLKHKCLERGLDISASLTVDTAVSSCYVCINNEDGDMVSAVNDMDIYEHITPEYIEKKLPLINKSALCVIDTNIPARTIAYIAEHCTVPLIAEPVSAHKAVKLLPVLHKLYALTPNKMEAFALYNASKAGQGTSPALAELARFFIESGTERIYISLGEKGLFCADKNARYRVKPFVPENADRARKAVRKGADSTKGAQHIIKNTTGAGDSQTAAVVWAVLKNMSLKESADAGIAAASLCLESEEAVNDNLTEGVLYERIQKIS